MLRRSGALPCHICNQATANHEDRLLGDTSALYKNANPLTYHTFLKMPNLVIESTICKNVSMLFAFSPIIVLCTFSSTL